MSLASEAMKLSVAYKMEPTNELATYGIHTGKRTDTDDIDACMNALEDWHHSDVHSYMGTNVLVTVSASYWSSGGGFTGWHNIRSYNLSSSSGGGPVLPHQDAVVIGYRTNVSLLSGIPAGRKRNRFYVGPIRVSICDSYGDLSVTSQNGLAASAESLHNALAAIPVDEGTAPGLLVVSPTGDDCYPATQVTIGRAVDTMRSRRSQTLENPLYADLTV